MMSQLEGFQAGSFVFTGERISLLFYSDLQLIDDPIWTFLGMVSNHPEKKKKMLPRSVRNIEADMEILIVLKQHNYQHKTSIYMAEK